MIRYKEAEVLESATKGKCRRWLPDSSIFSYSTLLQNFDVPFAKKLFIPFGSCVLPLEVISPVLFFSLRISSFWALDLMILAVQNGQSIFPCGGLTWKNISRRLRQNVCRERTIIIGNLSGGRIIVYIRHLCPIWPCLRVFEEEIHINYWC